VRQAVSEIFRVPVVGSIAAGLPVPQSDFSSGYTDAENAVEIASSLLPSRERPNELFALKVQGESMIDALVYDGDIVILKRMTETPRNGEMVAIWLNDRDETTLKYFYKEKDGSIRLQPANRTMKAILIKDPATVEVHGKVVMVVRQFEGKAL
jgi:repressor LexA